MVKIVPTLPAQSNWVDYPLGDVLAAWNASQAGVCKSGKSIKVQCTDGVRVIALAKKDQGSTKVSDFPSLRVTEVTRDGETFPVAFTPGTGEQADWFSLDEIFNAKVTGKTL